MLKSIPIKKLPNPCQETAWAATQRVKQVRNALKAVAGNSLSHHPDGNNSDFNEGDGILCTEEPYVMRGTPEMFERNVPPNATKYEIWWFVPLWRELRDLWEERVCFTTENARCAIYFTLQLVLSNEGKLCPETIFSIFAADFDAQKSMHVQSSGELQLSEDVFFQLCRIVERVERLTSLRCKSDSIYSQWFGTKAQVRKE